MSYIRRNCKELYLSGFEYTFDNVLMVERSPIQTESRNCSDLSSSESDTGEVSIKYQKVTVYYTGSTTTDYVPRTLAICCKDVPPEGAYPVTVSATVTGIPGFYVNPLHLAATSSQIYVDSDGCAGASLSTSQDFSGVSLQFVRNYAVENTGYSESHIVEKQLTSAGRSLGVDDSNMLLTEGTTRTFARPPYLGPCYNGIYSHTLGWSYGYTYVELLSSYQNASYPYASHYLSLPDVVESIDANTCGPTVGGEDSGCFYYWTAYCSLSHNIVSSTSSSGISVSEYRYSCYDEIRNGSVLEIPCKYNVSGTISVSGANGGLCRPYFKREDYGLPSPDTRPEDHIIKVLEGRGYAVTLTHSDSYMQTRTYSVNATSEFTLKVESHMS